ncbi:MAG: acetyl-CoA carboxylase biotin carboxyl carrier protein [Alphaproteobacteria bacterium]
MARFDLDPELIRRLAALLEETGLSEIEVTEGRRHVRVARGPTGAMVPAASHAPPATAAVLAALAASSAAARSAPGHAPPAGAVTSPMVGTAFLAPEPGAPAFVKPGDVVAEGQTLVIVEAMKVMNPIKAPRAGMVLEIRVANGAPVEYGEVLLVLG